MATTNVSANENKKINNNVNSFDRDAYEQGKEPNQQDKIEGLEAEIKFYNSSIREKKKDIARLERNLRVAKRELKAAKEAQRAERIKALLEANKGKRVVIEWEIDYTLFSEEVDNIYFYKDNNNDLHMCLSSIGQSIPLCLLERIYVEAEI